MVYNFIVNPNSGGGKGLKVWNRTRRYLNKCRADYEVYMTVGSGDAEKKARELTEGSTEEMCIIAIGGDGTVNEVFNGLSPNAQVVMGYIPSGSGNDLARGLGYKGSIRRYITKIISDSYEDRMDYGVMSCAENDTIRRFMVSTGIGFDAAVCHLLLNSGAKDGAGRFALGNFAYLTAGIHEFFASRSSKGYVVLDGARKIEFNSILFISVHIHKTEGGGYKFAPDADPKDGMLDICVVSTRNKFMLIPILLRSKNGLKGGRGVHHFTCSEAKIHVDQPLAVHTDGESCRYQTDLDVRCIQQQLRILR